jgi:hypothetical protein
MSILNSSVYQNYHGFNKAGQIRFTSSASGLLSATYRFDFSNGVKYQKLGNSNEKILNLTRGELEDKINGMNRGETKELDFVNYLNDNIK